MRTLPLLVLTGLLLLPALGQAQQVADYGRDGTRIFPGTKPPTQFTLPQDLRWEFRLNGWGHGSPIVVGDQVLAVIEATPTCDWPQLISVDLKTGKERWRAVLDAAEAIAGNDAATRQAITADWHLFRQRTIRSFRFREAFRLDPEKAKADWLAAGGTYEGPDHKPRMTHPDDEPAAVARNRLAAHGIIPETWHEHRNQSGIDALGHAYPTPVSDGKAVYVTTSDGLYAAFDLTGKRRWLVHSKGNLHAGDYCYNGRSPILYKNLLISDMTNKVRAFDTATGKLLWTDDGPKEGGDKEGCHTIVSPMVLTVGGKDLLWAAGNGVYLLPDGKRVKTEGWTDYGMQTLVKHDERDVIFFCGAGEHCGWKGKGDCPTPPPAAVRFAWQDEVLKATVLWSGINGKAYGGNMPWMVYDGGRLYCPNQGAVEALTGKIAFGPFAGKRMYQLTVTPRTSHLLQIANGHTYGLHGTTNVKEQNGGGFLDVCTLAGKPVATSVIPAPVSDAAEKEIWAACALYYNSQRFSTGWTFTFSQDAIIVRSHLRLYCIGPK